MKIIRKPEVDNNWLSPEIECHICFTVYQGDRFDIYQRKYPASKVYYAMICPACFYEFKLDDSILPWDLRRR